MPELSKLDAATNLKTLKTTMMKQEWDIEAEGKDTHFTVCPNVEAKYEMI